MAKIESKQNDKINELNKVVKRAALTFWADFLWYTHFAIVIFAVGLFFIPLSFWPNRIIFHFYYLWGVIALQFATGIIYMPIINKFRFVCPLSALEKHLIKHHPHEHVGESCIADFCAEKLGFPKWIGTASVLIALALVSLQYFKIT